MFFLGKVHDLGEVHDFLGVRVDGDGPGHGGGRTVDGVAGQVGAFAAVVLLLNQVVPEDIDEFSEMFKIMIINLTLFLCQCLKEQQRVVKNWYKLR